MDNLPLTAVLAELLPVESDPRIVAYVASCEGTAADEIAQAFGVPVDQVADWHAQIEVEALDDFSATPVRLFHCGERVTKRKNLALPALPSLRLAAHG